MKCSICGRDEATNYTWSEEWICDECVKWFDKLPPKITHNIFCDETFNEYMFKTNGLPSGNKNI